MAVATETVAVRYEDVQAGVPISVPYPVYEALDVRVYYGSASLLAVYNTDYTVSLADDFDTFTLTPTASLIAKINDLIAADPTEENYITVRRQLDYLTDATAAAVRYTPFTAREFDRTAMRFQQVEEKLNRAVVLSPTFVGDEPLLQLNEIEPGATLIFNENGTAIIAGENLQDYVDQVSDIRDVTLEARDVTLAARDTALDHANDALTAKTHAELAALAAGAPLYTSEPDIGTAPSPYLLHVEAGTQVYTHDGTDATMVGWLGKVEFPTVAALKVFIGPLGPEGTEIEAQGFRYEVAAIDATDAHLETAAPVYLRIASSEAPLKPEMFGAQAIESLSDTFDSTSALQKLAAAVNEDGRPALLSGIYSTEAALEFIRPDLMLTGYGPAKSAILGRDTDGIKLTIGPNQNVGFTIEGFSLLADSPKNREGLVISSQSQQSSWNKIERVGCVGADIFFNPALDASLRQQSWLNAISLDGARRVKIQMSRLYGAEADRLGNVSGRFPDPTKGVKIVNSNHIYMEDVFAWMFAHGLRAEGSAPMEDIQVRYCTMVANKRGVDIQATSGVSNDHKIIGTHIASYDRNIDLFSTPGSSPSTIAHTVSNNLLFAREDVSDTMNFVHIAVKAGLSNVSENKFYAAGLANPVANNHVCIDLVSGAASTKNKVVNNQFLSQNICVRNNLSHTQIDGNQTLDNATTGAVDPYTGSGTNAVFGVNGGDRANRWPSPTIKGGLRGYADDVAAAAGGIPVGGLYRFGSEVRIRLS